MPAHSWAVTSLWWPWQWNQLLSHEAPGSLIHLVKWASGRGPGQRWTRPVVLTLAPPHAVHAGHTLTVELAQPVRARLGLS